MSAANEERLTRAEWELVVARERCGADGHDFTVYSQLGGEHDGPLRVTCGQCGRVWPIATELMRTDLDELSRAFTIASEELAESASDGAGLTPARLRKRAADIRARIREEAREVPVRNIARMRPVDEGIETERES